MKVLVVGSGGRESALCSALSRDPGVSALACAPGNPGSAEIAEPLPLNTGDPAAVADLAARINADLTVIGPEVPLVAGAVDELNERGLAGFGPTAAAARLEGSKAFAKAVMTAAGVPTARGRDHHDVPTALADLDDFGPPYVVKYDGLAAGKGVTVTLDHDAAAAAVRAALRTADDRVVIEEFLEGPEVSLFCVVSAGGAVVPLTPAQDFKRALDGDEGLNTGGMGAYSPLPWAPADLAAEVVRLVAAPTVTEMARRDTPFTGLLYIGLALTEAGPKVIEFNVRFGDPETQAVLPRLTSPLTALLRGEPPTWSDDAAVTVVVAAPGYPAAPQLGGQITGLTAAAAVPGASVLHAGTRREPDGRIVSAGGRVLAVTGLGLTSLLRECAYEAVRHIRIAGGQQVRTDIAQRAATQTNLPAGCTNMKGHPEVADPKVAIVYGSPSDANVMSKAGAMLDRFGVGYEEVSISAHRAPAHWGWLSGLEERGIEVIIAGAGLSAALPGVCAAHSALPVIGVPIRGGALDGLDALLAIAQMPPGVPVACVGLDNSTNAAVLAVQIIAGHEPGLRTKLTEFKDSFEQAAAAGLGG